MRLHGHQQPCACRSGRRPARPTAPRSSTGPNWAAASRPSGDPAAGEPQHQQRLGDQRQPVADLGDQLAAEEEPEVAGPQGAERLTRHPAQPPGGRHGSREAAGEAALTERHSRRRASIRSRAAASRARSSGQPVSATCRVSQASLRSRARAHQRRPLPGGPRPDDPAVGRVRLAHDVPIRLEAGHDAGDGRRGHPLVSRQLAEGHRAVVLDGHQDGELARGEARVGVWRSVRCSRATPRRSRDETSRTSAVCGRAGTTFPADSCPAPGPRRFAMILSLPKDLRTTPLTGMPGGRVQAASLVSAPCRSRPRCTAANADARLRIWVRERWSMKCRRTRVDVIGCGGLEHGPSLRGEDREHDPPVLGRRLPDDEALLDHAVEPSGDAGGREVQRRGEIAHAQALVGCLGQGDQHGVVALGEAVALDGLGLQRRHDGGVGVDHGPPGRPSPRRRASSPCPDPIRAAPGATVVVTTVLYTCCLASSREYLSAQSSCDSSHDPPPTTEEPHGYDQRPHPRHLDRRPVPLDRRVHRPPPDDHQGARPLHRLRRHGHRRRRTASSRASRPPSTWPPIDTGDAGRDEHLRSADFFDVDERPHHDLRQHRRQQDGGDYVLVGDLTIKGVTRPVEFELEFDGVSATRGAAPGRVHRRAEINRKDWGLEWNVALETGGVLVGDKIKVAARRPAVARSRPRHRLTDRERSATLLVGSTVPARRPTARRHPMKIHELGHLVLYVRDLERSGHFYRDVLGFPELPLEGTGFPAAARSARGRTHHELLLIEVGEHGGPAPAGSAGRPLPLRPQDRHHRRRAARGAGDAPGQRRHHRRRHRPHGDAQPLHRRPRRQRGRALHRRPARGLARRPDGVRRPHEAPAPLTHPALAPLVADPPASRSRSVRVGGAGLTTPGGCGPR